MPEPIVKYQLQDCRKYFDEEMQELKKTIKSAFPETIEYDVDGMFFSEVRWYKIKSVFWFGSEIRKARLFFKSETPDDFRIRSSLEQLKHHAIRINIDPFSIDTLNIIIDKVKSKSFSDLSIEEKNAIAIRLTELQDKFGAKCREIDSEYEDEPAPGNPLE